VAAQSADDVASAVRAAATAGLRVAVQGTGHGATALGPLDDTVLLRTAQLRDVRVDPARRIARAEAGAVWGDVTAPAAEHGLTPLSGFSSGVGIAGYTLGGGLGWLGRRYGLACNRVTAIEVVLADGTAVRADADTEAELFWALRGGGGAFGAVTALEFELLPLTEVVAGQLFFPLERAAEVLHAWREWVPTVPDEVTSVGRMLRLPPLPMIPEPLRGGTFAVVEAAILLDPAQADELLAPLRALGPAIDMVAPMPVPGLSMVHMDPLDPVPGHGGADLLLRELPAEAIDRLVEAVGPDSGATLLSMELRHLGGALGRAEAGAGALASLDGEFLSFGVGMALSPEMDAATGEQLEAAGAALAPYGTGASVSNFVESPRDPSEAFPAAVLPVLRRIAERVDPDGLFISNHPLTAATGSQPGGCR